MELDLRRHSKKRSSGPEDSLTWSLQALLLRHEAYIADAEAERARMHLHITTLETSNHTLESRNTSLLEENRALEDQLESVNNAVAEAEGQVKSLTATLHTTQRELERVTRLTKRTEDLENQLLDCERQQAQLQATLSRSVEEERATNQKWRASQRRLLELEQEIEAVEIEASQDRAAHEETIARLGRRKVVEEELDRPNNAMPFNTRHKRGGSEVVSSFVREILQDNANMQLAMSELREMLAFYKDAHQPPMDLEPVPAKRHVSLGEELGMTEQQRQELHVHHHYHAPQQTERSKPQPMPRARRKRPVLMSGRSSGRSTPIDLSSENAQPLFRHKAASSTSSSIISNRVRPITSNRWSAHSTNTESSFALSSDLSSPQSTSYAPSTMFERALSTDGTEYSQPTTPEWSPVMRPQPAKSSSDDVFQPLSIPPLNSTMISSQETIVPTLLGSDLDYVLAQSTSPTSRHCPIRNGTSPVRRALRRSDSHASLMSISGMDIHTSLLEVGPPKFLLASRQQTEVVLTATTASAMSRSSGSAQLARSLQGKLSTVAESHADRYDPLNDTFGNLKRMGGWLTGRWGGGSSADLRSKAATDAEVRTGNLIRPTIPEAVENAARSVNDTDMTSSSNTSVLSTEGDLTPKAKTPVPTYRPPGINQMGGLPPLPQPKRAWMRGKLDEEALKECLNE